MAVSSASLAVEAFSSNLVGTWHWDISAGLNFCGPEMAKSFNLDADTAAHGAAIEAYYAAIRPDDRDRVAAANDAAIREGRPFQETYWVCNHKGWRRLHGSGQCYFDGSGNPTVYGGHVTDVTDMALSDHDLRILEDLAAAGMRIAKWNNQEILAYLFAMAQMEAADRREKLGTPVLKAG